jgi:hypothetical protein
MNIGIENTMAKRKKIQKDKQRSTKHTYNSKVRVTQFPLKPGELWCSNGTRRVNIVSIFFLFAIVFSILQYTDSDCPLVSSISS